MLDGRVTWVTGIGRGTAIAFAQACAKIALTGRWPDALAKTAAIIGDAALVVPADLTDPADVIRFRRLWRIQDWDADDKRSPQCRGRRAWHPLHLQLSWQGCDGHPGQPPSPTSAEDRAPMLQAEDVAAAAVFAASLPLRATFADMTLMPTDNQAWRPFAHAIAEG